jgi:hypothetical protein
MEKKDTCAGNCKKHPCQDCTFCQWCSDDRCRMCRGKQSAGKKLSTAEQIALYEALNQKKPA